MVLYCFLCVVIASMSSIFARRPAAHEGVVVAVDAAEEKPTPDLESLTDTDARYKNHLKVIAEKAKRDVEHIARSAERQKEGLTSKMKKAQSRQERRIEELKRKHDAEQVRLQKEIEEQATELERQKKEQEKMVLLEAKRQADELAQALKQQDEADQKAGRVAITSEWRSNMADDFEKDVRFIRQVVMEGEVSRVERQNFTTLFAQQQEWFDAKLKAAAFFFDDAYTLVVQKRNTIAAVVDAQKQADDLIMDIVSRYHFPATVQAQLRLMALHEINNHVQNSQNPALFLSADVVENLVNKMSIDSIPGRREIHFVSSKERLRELEDRIAHLQQDIVRRQAVADKEAADSKYLREREAYALNQQLEVLKRERDESLCTIGKQQEIFGQEKQSLVGILEHKQREKAELEIRLAQMAEHMKILTTRSQARLFELARGVSTRLQAEKGLREALEMKARKQAEAEIALARVNQEIIQLSQASGMVLQSLMSRVTFLQDRCKTLGGLLEHKQRECVLITQQAHKIQALQHDVLMQVADSHTRIEELQEEVRAIAAKKDAAAALLVNDFREEIARITERSEQEIAVLATALARSEEEVAEKQKAFAEMERLQQKIAKLRTKRSADAQSAAAHAQLLARMASFGDTILADYNRIQSASRGVQEAHKELNDLLTLVRDSSQEPDPAEVLRALELALQILGETSVSFQGAKQPL